MLPAAPVIILARTILRLSFITLAMLISITGKWKDTLQAQLLVCKMVMVQMAYRLVIMMITLQMNYL